MVAYLGVHEEVQADERGHDSSVWGEMNGRCSGAATAAGTSGVTLRGSGAGATTGATGLGGSAFFCARFLREGTRSSYRITLYNSGMSRRVRVHPSPGRAWGRCRHRRLRAGYQRTRAGAARFSDEPAMRRPAPALAQARQEPATPVVTAPAAGKPPGEAGTGSIQPPQGVQRSAKRVKTDPVKPATPAPVAAAQPLAEPPQGAATELPPAQVTVPEPAPPPAPPKPEYRDGTYYGWARRGTATFKPACKSRAARSATAGSNSA